MKILITGGAGYVGSALCLRLQYSPHHVVVYDNLMYGGAGLLPVVGRSNFEFVHGDIRDMSRLENAARGCDLIVHLAAIVGYPACQKSEAEASSVNVTGSRIVSCLGPPVIFASTQSVYGKQTGLVTEYTQPNPQSSYAMTKRGAEMIFQESGKNWILRFPTLFGVSPRMRWDLLLNDFAYRAVTDKVIVLYQAKAMRPVLPLSEAVRVYMDVISEACMPGVYNVGHKSMVFSKEEICSRIRAETDRKSVV